VAAKDNAEDKKTAPSYSAPALDKGLDILELLHSSENSLTQKEISTRLGRSVSELYRMLNLLVRRGYITNYDDKFSPSAKLFQLSQAHPPFQRLLTAAIPIMEELSRDVGFGCDLRVYNRGSQTILASVEAPSGMGFFIRPGAEIEIGPSASGRVIIAFQDAETMEIRLRESFPNASSQEVKLFRKDVHEVAVKGHAAIQSKQYSGLFAISFPVLDLSRHAVGAITVPMLPRIDGVVQTSKSEVIERLKIAASRISQRIG
jgi:DNA-binding IclR family transcriptional regulator